MTHPNIKAWLALRYLGAPDARVFERPGGPVGSQGSDYVRGTVDGRLVLLVASGGMGQLWRAGVYCRRLGRMVWSSQYDSGITAVRHLRRHVRGVWAEVHP